MENYTRNTIIDSLTGEIKDEFFTQKPKAKPFYVGPRKYWRTMELYDKAQLLLGSKVGIHLMIYLKLQVDTSNYRITINQTWLAEDIGATREAVAKNLKKLITNGYIKKERRNKYFVNPKLFWISGMDGDTWQNLKKEYEGTTVQSKSKEDNHMVSYSFVPLKM